MDSPNHILLFDGLCNLCSGAVQFLIRIDKKAIIHFAPLESGFAKMRIANGVVIKTDSVVYVKGKKMYQKSRAIIEVLNDIGGIWKIVNVMLVFPQGLTDRLYDFIAIRRYRWFGKKDRCMVPGPDSAKRFLA